MEIIQVLCFRTQKEAFSEDATSEAPGLKRTESSWSFHVKRARKGYCWCCTPASEETSTFWNLSTMRWLPRTAAALEWGLYAPTRWNIGSVHVGARVVNLFDCWPLRRLWVSGDCHWCLHCWTLPLFLFDVILSCSLLSKLEMT